jgi:kynurenine formamidase
MTNEEMLKLGNGVPGDPLGGCTTFLGMIDHVGTHVDAFIHTNPLGQTIDEMPLDLFWGKAVCLDIRHVPDHGDITAADLELAEKQSGVKIDGHIVLLCSGFHKRHYPNESVVRSNAGITLEASHWLADRSRVHGVEGPSTDKPTSNEYPNHRVCRDRGMIHYEWLVELEPLIGLGEFEFYGLPLKIDRGSGSPVRAIAFVD